MGEIYLIRHAQASFGKDNYDELSELGKLQSRIVGEYLKPLFGTNLVFSGTMKRHVQTAQPYISLVDPSPFLNIDQGFDEFDYEDIIAQLDPRWAGKKQLKTYLRAFEDPGKKFQQIFTQAIARWLAGEHDHTYRESWSEFRDRVVSTLLRVQQSVGASKKIVIFTSGGPICAICQWLLELGVKQTLDLNENLVNTGITRLLYNTEKVSLSYLNSYGQLECNGSHLVTFR